MGVGRSLVAQAGMELHCAAEDDLRFLILLTPPSGCWDYRNVTMSSSTYQIGPSPRATDAARSAGTLAAKIEAAFVDCYRAAQPAQPLLHPRVREDDTHTYPRPSNLWNPHHTNENSERLLSSTHPVALRPEGRGRGAGG